MIKHTDQQFIDHWIDQKSGPKWKYYFTFSLAWTVVSFLVIFFLTKLFTQLWETGGANLIYTLVTISIIIGILSTHFSYVWHEKRYHDIVKKNEITLN
ncbi:MAG: hypothetical protein ABI266_07535 [Ginsengibacter sp.]